VLSPINVFMCLILIHYSNILVHYGIRNNLFAYVIIYIVMVVIIEFVNNLRLNEKN